MTTPVAVQVHRPSREFGLRFNLSCGTETRGGDRRVLGLIRRVGRIAVRDLGPIRFIEEMAAMESMGDKARLSSPLVPTGTQGRPGFAVSPTTTAGRAAGGNAANRRHAMPSDGTDQRTS